jgi:hypothetical protein
VIAPAKSAESADRTIATVRGGAGKRLTYRQLRWARFSFVASRFLRWRKKRRKS